MRTIELIDLQLSDYSTLASWFADKDLQVAVAANTFSFPMTEEELAEFLRPCRKNPPARRCWKAVDDGGAMVGMICYARIDWKDNNGHLAFIVVEPQSRSKGIGKQMLEAALRIGFTDYGFHRVSLNVYPSNEAAIRFYETIGFRKEGLTRNVIKIDGRYLDLIPMSLLKDEWAAR